MESHKLTLKTNLSPIFPRVFQSKEEPHGLKKQVSYVTQARGPEKCHCALETTGQTPEGIFMPTCQEEILSSVPQTSLQ